MFSRFFKKSRPSDQREHYRRAPGKKAALGVRLVLPTGEAVGGELVDVSAGGAAVVFESDMASILELDGLYELRFTSLTRGNMKVRAAVRGVPRPGTPHRYGFQFVDPADLFRQLDESFYKYFNRRRWVRAQPALDRRISAQVAFGESEVDLDVHDISLEGVGFVLPSDFSLHIAPEVSVEVSLDVPRTDSTVTFFGLVRHMTATTQGTRVGVALDPAENQQNKKRHKKDLALLAEYIAKRVEEMERYNTAFH